jgi:hypothetical protein
MESKCAWGPDNPHPLSRLKTELVWEGKCDEFGNRRPVSLPASSRLMPTEKPIDLFIGPSSNRTFPQKAYLPYALNWLFGPVFELH